MSTPRQALPVRCHRRRMGVCRALSDPDARRRVAAQPRPARGLQRPALAGAHAARSGACCRMTSRRGSRLPADPALAARRAASRRWSTICGCCCGWRPGRSGQPTRRDSGRAHAAIDARERRAGGLRRAQAPQGLQGACGGGYARATCWRCVVTPANEQERAQVADVGARRCRR